MQWLRYIIEEAWSSMDSSEYEPGLSNDSSSRKPPSDPAEMAVAVIRIWSRLFSRNAQWPIINIIGQSLFEYALLLEGKG